MSAARIPAVSPTVTATVAGFVNAVPDNACPVRVGRHLRAIARECEFQAQACDRLARRAADAAAGQGDLLDAPDDPAPVPALVPLPAPAPAPTLKKETS